MICENNYDQIIKLGQESNTFADLNTVPDIGSNSPEINFNSVDFPIPFGPTTTQKGTLVSTKLNYTTTSSSVEKNL